MDEFMAQLRQGYCLVPQPFNTKKFRRISLLPSDVDCIVFWTRNPWPLLANIPEIETRGYGFYVHVTLTGYPRAIEPRVPDIDVALDAMQALSEKIGPERIVWRYDPVFLAKGTTNGAGFYIDESWHKENFGCLASRIGSDATGRGGLVRQVTISLLDEYRNTRSRLYRAGFPEVTFGTSRGTASRTTRATCGTAFGTTGANAPPASYVNLLSELARIARAHKFAMKSCAEPWDLSAIGIEHGACIDGELISHIVAEKAEQVRPANALHESTQPLVLANDKGQRPFCRCVQSVDIGTYGACPTGCVYCYARQ